MQNEGGAIPACPKCGDVGELRRSSDREVEWVRCKLCGHEGGLAYSQEEAIRLWSAYTPIAAASRPETGEGAHALGPNATILDDDIDGFECVALLVGNGTVYLQQGSAQVFLGFRQARDLSAALVALGQQGAAS